MRIAFCLFLSFLFVSCQTHQKPNENSIKNMPFEIQDILREFPYLNIKNSENQTENRNVIHFEMNSKKDLNKNDIDAINKYIREMLIQNKWALTISGNGYATFSKGKNTFSFLIKQDYSNKNDFLQIHITIAPTKY